MGVISPALLLRPNIAFVSLYYNASPPADAVLHPLSSKYVSLSKIRYLVASLKPYASAPSPLAWPLGLSPSCGVIVGVGLHLQS